MRRVVWGYDHIYDLVTIHSTGAFYYSFRGKKDSEPVLSFSWQALLIQSS
jgi:hypothetical protein